MTPGDTKEKHAIDIVRDLSILLSPEMLSEETMERKERPVILGSKTRDKKKKKRRKAQRCARRKNRN